MHIDLAEMFSMPKIKEVSVRNNSDCMNIQPTDGSSSTLDRLLVLQYYKDTIYIMNTWPRDCMF